MIQAAINPETGEFLGVIVPKADLTGAMISIWGAAEDWDKMRKGEQVDPHRAGVLIRPSTLESVEVEGVQE